MAVPCWLLGQRFPIVGGPVFGILAGMIITLLWRDKSGGAARHLVRVEKRCCSTPSSCSASA